MFDRDHEARRFEASKVVLHESYDGVHNDLALVTLGRSVPANLTSAKAVCLPKSGSKLDFTGKVRKTGLFSAVGFLLRFPGEVISGSESVFVAFFGLYLSWVFFFLGLLDSSSLRAE